MTQNKDKLCREVQKTCDYSMVEIGIVVDLFLGAVADALIRGERIELRRFGIMKTYKTKSRLVRNPKIGTPIQTSPRRKVKFVASKKLLEDLNAKRNNGTHTGASREGGQGLPQTGSSGQPTA